MGWAIKLFGFEGEAPSMAPAALPPTMAQTAQNVKLGFNSIKPIYDKGDSLATLESGTLTIFRYKGDGDQWFNRAADVNFVNSPVSQDAYGRVYFTGDGRPRVTSSADWDADCGA